MSSINVDGLPEPVVRSLETIVSSLKQQYVSPAESCTPLERMKRAAGGWNDDPEGLDAYLEEVRLGRGRDRMEPAE